MVLAVTAAVAGLDEWHQAFVPGRAARVSDVGLDTIGGMVGLVAGRALDALRGRSQC